MKAAVFYTHTHTHTHTHGCLCKIILSIIAIAIITPTYAKDSNNHIEPSPTNDCVESTLGTATGPANLEADWTANTLTIDWYNGDTKLSSNTCRYDGQITLPSTNPTKTGYTFRGWQVRAAAPAVSYESCEDIPDETTCDEHVYELCTWGSWLNHGNGGCYTDVYLAPNKEVCEDNGGEWQKCPDLGEEQCTWPGEPC